MTRIAVTICRSIFRQFGGRYSGVSCRQFSQDTAGSDTGDGSQTESAQQTSDSDDKEYEVKQKILVASLPFVNQHGWTEATLAAGAVAVGYPGTAHGLFPRGGVELINYFYVDCNRKLADQLADQVKQQETEQTEPGAPRIRPFIRGAVETRLRMITPYIEKWPQAMGILALPPNVQEAFSNLTNLTDDIWHFAGDKSTDFNWYTKRMSLAAVYKSTEIFMVQDTSEDFYDTWEFLDRRIEDMSNIGNMIRNSQQSSTVLSEAFKGATIMAQNILGANSRSK